MELEKLIGKLHNRTPRIIDFDTYTKFAVLIPLIKKDDEFHVLFEVRAYNLRRQPGEICFPGGKMDEDDQNEKHSAIRETCEELGIHENQMKHIFPLDYLISPYGTVIYPFVGVLSEPEKITPNPSEVAEIFTVPLSFFLKTKPECYKIHLHVQPEENFPFELINGGRNYKWQVRQVDELFFHYHERVIWGLTAQLLVNFIKIIKDG